MADIGSLLVGNALQRQAQDDPIQKALNIAHSAMIDRALGLSNKMTSATLPGMIAARNAQSQGVSNTGVPLAAARLALAQAQVPALQANTARTVEGTKLLPQQMDISKLNSLLNAARIAQSQNRFGTPGYTATRWLGTLPTSVRTATVAQNPGLYSNITQKQLSELSNPQQQQTQQNDVLGLAAKMVGVNPVELGISSQTVNSQQQPQVQLSPQTTDAMQSAAKNQLIKETVPTNIQNQRYYSATAGSIYNNTSQFIPSVSNFAGYSGSFNKLLDGIQSGAIKGGSQDYDNLLKFKQNIPLLGNELRRLLGGAATDKESALIKQVTDPALFNKSPRQVMGLWQNLGNLLNNLSSPLKEDQSTIASKLGREAVIPGQIPTFNTKAEFTAWFNRLTPKEQQMVVQGMQ